MRQFGRPGCSAAAPRSERGNESPQPLAHDNDTSVELSSMPRAWKAKRAATPSYSDTSQRTRDQRFSLHNDHLVCVRKSRCSSGFRARRITVLSQSNRSLAACGSVRISADPDVLQAGYKFSKNVNVVIDVFNLFDAADSDIDCYYASRLPGEPFDGVNDIHLHPTLPITARVNLMVGF
jgi:hypothetical protein